jgi:5-methylcytosine-specific restriction endonuclease McrA
MSKYGRLKYGNGIRRGYTSKQPSVNNTYGKDWSAISTYVKQRDNYQCQAHKIGLSRCFNRFPPPFSRLLHVHHIYSRAKFKCDDPKILVTLCSDCHSLTHKRQLAKPITEKQKLAGRKFD